MTTKKKQRKARMFEGLPVVDAAQSFELTINKDDVKAAKKNDPARCAAALACQRKFHNKEVRVFLTRTYVKDKNKWVRFVTPQAVSREIVSFDRGAAFVPGHYKINAPTSSARLGHYHSGSAPSPRNDKPKRPHHTTANVRESAKTYSGSK